MSELNRKGPFNQGSRSGRGLGKCNPNNKGKSDEEIIANRDNELATPSNFQRRCRSNGMRRQNFRKECARGSLRGNNMSLWNRIVGAFSKTKQ